ncbi:hypothetical protein [Streptomyces sp. NPDC001020]
MSARTHTRPHPATTGGVEIRLPWWALALPALAFVALLALILDPADTSTGQGPALNHLIAGIQQAVTRYAP